MDKHLEDMNYLHDHRVIAGEEAEERRLGFDEKAMTLTFLIDVEEECLTCKEWDADADCDACQDCAGHKTVELETSVSLPAKFDVCGTCDGKGTHTNPSIDAGGLSREDFDEDPDFAEAYMSGFYDVQCYECAGRRVVPVIDEAHLNAGQLKQLERVHEKEAADAYYQSQCRHEREMGY